MNVSIVIPTYNRAHCLDRAVDSALGQSYSNLSLIVVDDASTDNTGDLIEKWLPDPRFVYLRLEQNVGTAQAKNVGMALSNFDAITFHDSDDIAHPDKILLQVRSLSLSGLADEILDWQSLGHTPGEAVQIDVAVGAHRFLKLDGTVHLIDKRISLVDDFFPTLQSPSKTEGDWILINSALFRRRCFVSLGGYLDSVEEDRELRNRLIASGHLFHFIAEPLLTKIEMEVSLTTCADTGYKGQKRRADREEVWRRNRVYRQGYWGKEAARRARVPLDLERVRIAEIRNGAGLQPAADLPMTPATRSHLEAQLAALNDESAKDIADLHGVPFRSAV